MTIGGWIVLISSITITTGLFGWCIWKVLTSPKASEHMHGFEFETPDEKAQREGKESNS
jgi:hypothetical protein